MQLEHIRLLKDLAVQVAGKNTEAIIDILKGEKPINEFRIADKLKLTINQARNILYKLYNQNIVSFIRKKDEKKGWYIYSWSLNLPKALERLKIIKEKEINILHHSLISRENKRFYKCPHECIGVNEENAMLHQFTCPECGSVLQLEASHELSQDLKHKIDNTKKEINEITDELKKIDDIRLIQVEKERLTKRKKRKELNKKAKKIRDKEKGKKVKKAKTKKRKIKKAKKKR